MQKTNASEIRQDLLTNRWVIYAPERGKRPTETKEERNLDTGELPGKDGTCPFCIGNEQMIPSIIHECTPPDTDGWRTRVVPNKYPVLEPDVEVAESDHDIYHTTTSYGRHEVVIETPFHNRDIPFMTLDEVESVIETYARRYSTLYGIDEALEAILIFRNHGARAGTSLRHPHSQIIATGFVPKSIAHREEVASAYYRRTRRCVLCDITEYERAQRSRLLSENPSFVAFVPFAAGVPYEVWIVPKQHCADFGLITEKERRQLASTLQDALQRLHDVLGDPDYNYVIHSGSRQQTLVPHLHWFLQIRPRLTTPAGFELGSGMEINPSLPEEDVELLRTECC